MALSNDLISEFVKLTNDKTETPKSTTAYGTIIESDGTKWVQLDGSPDGLLTPIETTTEVSHEDRVIVDIKDHTATVTGNLTHNSVSTKTTEKIGTKISEFELIVAYKVNADDINAVNGYFENLKSIVGTFESITTDDLETINASIAYLETKYADIDTLTANDVKALNADIENLKATFASIGSLSTDQLDAAKASIDQLTAYNANFTYVHSEILSALKANINQLEVDKLSAEDAKLKYVNIDFGNIDVAWLGEFFAKSGIIENIKTSNGTVTGSLVGVTIKGDLIEANTLVADKLVVRGSDGEYYKLNTDFSAMEGVEPIEEDAIHGSTILTNSIVAEKIDVDDLFAFDATLGGFNITDHSIYSRVKDTIDNTASGIYLDADGQMALGDGSNYLKYYRDRRYRLVEYSDNKYVVTNEYIESPYVKKYYKVDHINDIYTATSENIEPLDGEVIEGALTESGAQVYLNSTSGIYFYISVNDGEIVEGVLTDSGVQVFKGFIDDLTERYYIISDLYRLDVSAASVMFRGGESVEDALQETSQKMDEVNDNLSETIKNNYDDYRNFMTKFSKYIRFMEDENGNPSDTAMTIGSGDSAITLEIDNVKGLIFKKNGEEFGSWDGANFHTGNIMIDVNERAQFGNFAYIPRSDGSLSFLKVGG